MGTLGQSRRTLDWHCCFSCLLGVRSGIVVVLRGRLVNADIVDASFNAPARRRRIASAVEVAWPRRQQVTKVDDAYLLHRCPAAVEVDGRTSCFLHLFLRVPYLLYLFDLFFGPRQPRRTRTRAVVIWKAQAADGDGAAAGPSHGRTVSLRHA